MMTSPEAQNEQACDRYRAGSTVAEGLSASVDFDDARNL